MSYLKNLVPRLPYRSINYAAYLNHPYSGSSVPGGNFKFNGYYYVSQPDYCSLVNNSGAFYIKLDQNVQLISLEPGTPNYTAIFPTPTGDSIVWNLTDLRQNAMSLGGNIFTLNLYMVPTATIGLPYGISSGVLSNVTETTLLDNRSSGSWFIGGPFDPNYIEVTPKGTGTQGYIPTSITELLYTIYYNLAH